MIFVEKMRIWDISGKKWGDLAPILAIGLSSTLHRSKSCVAGQFPKQMEFLSRYSQTKFIPIKNENKSTSGCPSLFFR